MECNSCKKYCRIHEIFGRKVEATEEVEKYIIKMVDGVEEVFLWYEVDVCDGCLKMAENVDSGVLNVLSQVADLTKTYRDNEIALTLSEHFP